FVDADHAGCQDTRQSTSGSVQFLGERRISCSSKRQKSAAISSMEAEYIALSGCSLDEALVPNAQRLRIRRSNFRLPSDIQSKEPTLQVVYDILRNSPFFREFLVTADVPEIYMQEYWATAKLHQHSIRFKMDTRKHVLDLEAFREILHISPRIPGQSFAELPFEEEILEFLRFLGHSTQIKKLTDVNVNKLYQPWRSFAVVINKCLTGKSFSIDSLKISQAQILWGLYNGSNVDCAYLIWEDFVYQVEHKSQKKSNEMYYPRFTKVIIDYFMTRKPSIPKRNRVNWHYVRDDVLFTTIKGVSRHQTTQQYGVILLIELTNDDIRNNKAYKEYYACATGEAAPKPKASARKKTSGSASSTTPPPPITTSTPTTTVVAAPRLSAAAKGKQPARATIPTEPTDVERTEAEQLKIVLKQSRQETHISQQSGSGTDEGTGSRPGAVREAMQTQTNQLQDSIQRENDEFLKTIDKNMKKIIKEQVKTQVKAQLRRIFPRMEEAVNAQLEAEVLTRLSHSSRTSYDVAADLSKMEVKKILIKKMEGNKSIQRSDEQRNLYKALVEAYDADKTILDTYRESTILKRRREDDDQERPSAGSDRGSKRQRREGEHASASIPSEPDTESVGRSTTGSQSRQLSASADDQPIIQTTQHPEWFSQPRRPPTPDRDWNKSVPAAQREAQSWISALAKQTDVRSSFNELLDTPIDFTNFIMNRLGVDTLTSELLAGPTYELMRGSCNSLTELEYHLEEPLPLIPNNRGRSVIPFEHFINNDLEYLRGGASSHKYTTSVTKTKAADYGHIKWIEDLVPLNRESALDVYSKRRIIAVTKLKIVEWHNYKHLDWISVHRKLSNLTVEERFEFNVSLRMFTRSIVIQRRVEDLQLGVKSYQKRLNLTRPDMYRSDLKPREAYTTYSNPRGFIYQNKDKKNKFMWIDELHKLSDETLNDVRNALDDRLKGIRMQYLPTIIWRRGDKARAAAMIQATDKMLKTRRIIRSLERFVGGRKYKGDFRMLQRII
nr:retrovirus-related Pol polyprotein from transposon TNT 1-94 [Tanacetum cinerariifolium]